MSIYCDLYGNNENQPIFDNSDGGVWHGVDRGRRHRHVQTCAGSFANARLYRRSFSRPNVRAGALRNLSHSLIPFDIILTLSIANTFRFSGGEFRIDQAMAWALPHPSPRQANRCSSVCKVSRWKRVLRSPGGTRVKCDASQNSKFSQTLRLTQQYNM